MNPLTLDVVLGTRSYPIHIGIGLLDDHALWCGAIRGRHVLLVTNETIAPLYLQRVQAGLAGLERVHRHAGRLVDEHAVLVFVQHRERSVLRHRSPRPLDRQLDRDALPLRDRVAFLHALAVDAHEASLEQLLQLRARERELLADEEIDALAGLARADHELTQTGPRTPLRRSGSGLRAPCGSTGARCAT
jgi:hypothetical protein